MLPALILVQSLVQAQPAPDPNQFVVRLSSGATVRVLGVTDEKHRMWTASGSPLDARARKKILQAWSADGPWGPTRGTITVYFEAAEATTKSKLTLRVMPYQTQFRELRGGNWEGSDALERPGDALAFISFRAPIPRQSDFDVRVAYQKFRLLAQCEREDGRFKTVYGQDLQPTIWDPQHRKARPGQPKWTHIYVKLPPVDEAKTETKLVALDAKDGIVSVALNDRIPLPENGSGSALDQVKRLVYVARPFESVHFAGVRLRPNARAK